MAEVTCPQCDSRQPVDPDAEGYRCAVCAASWRFVRCTVCGERFHTRPGTRAWTCPTCGTPHGRNRRGISRVGLPIPLLVGALVAVGTPVPGSPSSTADPLRKVCRHLVDVQLLREDALARASRALTADAEALRAAGHAEEARAVEDIVAAIGTYREVARGGGDTQAATEQLLDSLDAVSC